MTFVDRIFHYSVIIGGDAKARKSFVSAVLLLFMTQPQAKGNESGWKIQQESDGFNEVSILCSHTAFRLDSRRIGWSMIAKAPKWQVTVFSKQSKKFKNISIRELQKEGLNLLESEDNQFGCQSAIGKRTQTFLGRRTTVLIIPNHKSTDLSNSEIGLTKFAKENFSKALNSEYYLTDLEGCPPQIGQILSGIYRLPQTNSIPLGFRRMYQNGITTTKMRTVKIEKASLDSEVFDLPSGYTSSANLNYITMPGTNVDHLTDWAAFENLGDMGSLKKEVKDGLNKRSDK